MTPKHHTSTGFRNNYVASVTRSLTEILRWQFARVRDRLPPPPSVVTPSVDADLKFVHANAAAGRSQIPAVTWIGHASMLVQADGINVLTDPIFSQRASPLAFFGPARAHPPGVALKDLPHIDVVVISHNHYDHLDRASVSTLANQAGGPPLFLVPLGLEKWLEKLKISHVVELDWWDRYTYRSEADPAGPVEFCFTPAQHWSARGLHDRNKTLWGSWAVCGEALHWFFTGDTGYSADFVDIRKHFSSHHTAERGGGFDIAMIAVGACLPRWFMQLQHVDLNEAVQIHLDLGAKRSVGVHWGTFELADEPLDQPIHCLGRARQAKNVTEQDFFLVAIGETRKLERRIRS